MISLDPNFVAQVTQTLEAGCAACKRYEKKATAGAVASVAITVLAGYYNPYGFLLGLVTVPLTFMCRSSANHIRVERENAETILKDLRSSEPPRYQSACRALSSPEMFAQMIYAGTNDTVSEKELLANLERSKQIRQVRIHDIRSLARRYHNFHQDTRMYAIASVLTGLFCYLYNSSPLTAVAIGSIIVNFVKSHDYLVIAKNAQELMPHTDQTIIRIDPVTCELRLNNGTLWEVIRYPF